MRPPMRGGGGSFRGREEGRDVVGGRISGGERDSCPEKKKERDHKKDPTSKLCSVLSDLRIERIGSPRAFQWISVYTKRPPMKQRYHQNVSKSRLHHHVEKSKEDGLFISCVASHANQWALVMDAGTAFTCQVYKLSTVFLLKDWIMEHWEKNYYISSIAGATDGSSLVVMSKGIHYGQQSYKLSVSFPLKWVDKKWKEGYHITCMATAGSRWGVVMSRNSGYSEQVVELDFLNPSEETHRRWESGYRITSIAATADQAVAIFSLPRTKTTDEIQETLRTSAFPSSYFKGKWADNMYITSLCYGRAVC